LDEVWGVFYGLMASYFIGFIKLWKKSLLFSKTLKNSLTTQFTAPIRIEWHGQGVVIIE